VDARAGAQLRQIVRPRFIFLVAHVFDCQRANLRKVSPDDRQRDAADHVAVDFINPEISQVFVKLRVAFEEHLPQFRMAGDDLLNSGNIMYRGRSYHLFLASLLRVSTV